MVDHVVEAHAMIGVSEKNFLKWVEQEKGVQVFTSDHELVAWLREQFFDEFAEDMNDAYLENKRK